MSIPEPIVGILLFVSLITNVILASVAAYHAGRLQGRKD